MTTLLQSILGHTHNVCQRVLPMMEQSAMTTNTSSIQVGGYTVTITISKNEMPSILGKRKAPIMEEIQCTREWASVSKLPSEFYQKPSSDTLLYNNFGHNFSDQNPHPYVTPAENLSYIC
jgi:pyocin large subunit-like protein